MIKLSTSLMIRLAELPEKETVIITVYDDELKKWSSAVIKCKPKELEINKLRTGGYETIYSTDDYKWEVAEDAQKEMIQIIDQAKMIVKIMSN